jgi:exopolysaccharide production protein ExoY
MRRDVSIPSPPARSAAAVAPLLSWLHLVRGPNAPLPLAERGEASPPAPVGGISKRVLDLAVAITALLLLSPLMIMVAALIKATSRGPVIYAHRRVGQGGRSFPCYKFRTMVPDGDTVLARHLASDPEAAREWQETRKLRRDPRITRIGVALRASSLDELPQLLNVLRGEMSCVGPRPVVEEELERFGPHAAEYLAARPGLTGLWQVSGRSSLTYDERVLLDSRYVRDWSLAADLVILLRTVGALLRTHQTA